MLAIEIRQHGGSGELRPVERPDPVPTGDELLVRNRWVGVNYVDLPHREGRPYPVALPLVPGIEAAGEVVAAGPQADPALVGRPVVHFGHLSGVYAELTAVPPAHVVALAPDAPLDIAAAVAMCGTTAYVLTHEATRPGAGDVVVVQAAAGATGGAVVQLAVAAGAEVVAFASSPAKAVAARALGAAHAFALAETRDPVAAVLDVTDGTGAPLVYDAGGRDSFDASLDMLAPRGTLVLYGQSSGPVEPFDPGRLSGITGVGRAGSLTLRWVSASNDYLRTAADRARAMATVLDAVAAGRFDPRIAGRFALARAADAHDLLASRGVLGKLLLDAS
jgi:NADPH2:quinone reductase